MFAILQHGEVSCFDGEGGQEPTHLACIVWWVLPPMQMVKVKGGREPGMVKMVCLVCTVLQTQKQGQTQKLLIQSPHF